MTLDFKKLVKNQIEKEITVHHFDGAKCEVFKKDEIPQSVTAAVQEKFGQTYLDDANYVVFFSAPEMNKDIISKYVFKLCNKALGGSANSLTESDFKIVELGGAAAPEPAEKPEADDGEAEATLTGDTDRDEDNMRAVADLIGDEDYGKEEETSADPVTAAEIADITGDDSFKDGGDSEDDEDSEEDPADSEEEIEDDDDDKSDDDGDDKEEDDDDDDDDEEDKDLDESVASPEPGEKFCFLKVTMK